MRKNFGPKPMCYPMPVYIIGTYNADGTPNAMNAAKITDMLGLHTLRHRNWYIQATCASSGDGSEGLDWLSNQLQNQK